MQKYDAAIIGGGADGLTAATVFARAGLKTIVLEKNARAGGRCQTREFYLGFRAPPFADDLKPIPASLFAELDLARRGVVTAPASVSSALWSNRMECLRARDLPESVAVFFDWLNAQRRLVRARVEDEIAAHARARIPFLRKRAQAWPLEDWADHALADTFAEITANESLAALLTASTLQGRSADPCLAGSALHLLAPGAGGFGLVRGGLETLGAALVDSAREAGAVIQLGLEATDIRHAGGKVTGVSLADGSEVEAATIVSTLDLKRTFLSLFKWQELPKSLVQRVRAFRMNGATARLLIALERPPELPAGAARGPIHIAPSSADMAHAHECWRSGALAARLPIALRLLSAVDPSLAPAGAAVATATVGAVPSRLFDGVWTRERRVQLEERVLGAVEAVLPGFRASIKAVDLIAPPDIEEAIGATDGDLSGGEIAADQMLSFRPWSAKIRGPRTPLSGLYLAGPSTHLGLMTTCGAGAVAARAALADQKRSWLP